MSANFTPTYNEYTKLPPFKGMVLQNFPFIEEDFDAITNYQLLCKVVEYLKGIMANEELLEENVTGLYNAFVSLQDYVNNYFDNLDVQEEINNKLDEMTTNGELTALIGNYVDPYILAQNSRLDSMQTQINSVASGSPLVASSTSGMTDTTRTYVNTTDGYWYYYNGTDWTRGGVYQSTGIANNSIDLQKLSTEQLEQHRFITDWVHGSANSTTGVVTNDVNRIRFFKKTYLQKGTYVKFTATTNVSKYAYQSWSTSSALPVIENSGWISTEDLVIDTTAYYTFMLKYDDNADIDDDDINTLSECLEFYRPVLNSANKMINCYSTNKPFEITEKMSSNRLNIKSNDTTLWIMFENFIEYYTINWGTINQTPNRKIKYNLGDYGTVTSSETSSSRDLIDVTLPTNYALVLNVLTGIMTVKPYAEMERTDGLLVRNANGYAMAGAFKEINDYWLGRMTQDINKTTYYDFNVHNVAHRGYSSIAPENTLPAYQLASKHNFKYVECDVSFTSDNVPVLLHDSTIDRTSNGTGNINNLTYDEVRQYDFGSWKSEVYAGTKIPSLEEFLLLCRNLGLYPYIELKDTATYSEAQIQGLVDLTNKYGIKDKCTWISFSSTYLGYVKNYDSKARIGYVVSNITNNVISIVQSLKTSDNEVFIDANYSNITTESITRAINNGFPVEVWTVTTNNHILNANPYVSGFTSNDLLAGKILYDNNIN